MSKIACKSVDGMVSYKDICWHKVFDTSREYIEATQQRRNFIEHFHVTGLLLRDRWPVDSPHKGLIARSFEDHFDCRLFDTPWRSCTITVMSWHDDVIKWKHFRRYYPFVRGIHRSPGNSPHKGQWRGALMFSWICNLKKRLSKQSIRRWFEAPSRSVWHRCNGSQTFSDTV